LFRSHSIASLWSIACGYALVGGAAVYGVVAWLAARARLPPQSSAAAATPKVTILKPLCGSEPETYDCLRSFCDQAYPGYQIIFGIADSDDPVIAIVERLKKEFPERDLRLVVDRRQHGSSRKISNLINMMSQASHDYLLLADSDVRVKPDYLTKVVAPLLDADVGIVTCAYRGVSRQGVWSTLGSMFINEWFMPSVRVAAGAGSRSFGFGATIALRREVLTRVGGFGVIANHLADDYRLAELTRGLGLRTVLSEVEVEVAVVETTFKILVNHELRWLRTIRAVRPMSYCFCFITFGIPVGLLGTLLTGGAPIASLLLGLTVAARVLLHLNMRPSNATMALTALVLPREILSLGLWGWSFMTRRVRWRDEHYHVYRDGSALPIARV
jgi:ceramide glucosyltransferase